MAGKDRLIAAGVSLDALAVHAFVREMTDLLDFVAYSCVFDADRKILWSQAFQNTSLTADDCLAAISSVPTEPTKVTLGSQGTVFCYPLPCENVSGLTFCLLISGSDPPSLSSVTLGIDPMLRCLARQIDVDCTLSTTKIMAVPSQPVATFTSRLEALLSQEDLRPALDELCVACMQDHHLDSVAVALPGQRIRAVAGSTRYPKEMTVRLLAKLQGPMNKKPRPLSARVSLADGSDGHVVCAPIMKGRQASGVVCLVSATADVSRTKLAKLIAGRIAAVTKAKKARSTFLSRFELLAKIEELLKGQPTLPHSLVYFDIDRMHTINDAFGYSGGDRVLGLFRNKLSDSAGAHDFVAHLGGDRFVLVMPGASGDTALAKASQVLRLLTQESIEDGKKSISLSASAGVVDNQAATEGPEDMLLLAEVASRGAQERGGNQCAVYQDIDSSIIQRRSDVDKVGFLQSALIGNEFELHAQEIRATANTGTRKYELLARMNTDHASGRSPAEFLSAAERYQLMAALDRWVINSALNTVAAAENSLEASLTTFGINVSAQSLQDDMFVDFVETRIAEAGIPPDTLCFELTETSLVRYIERAQRFVHRMQRLGCQIALDDFGTGYSSFSYLKSIPVNYLKIDGAFIRDVLESELSKTIVSSVVAIAKVIGAETVAEHVESPLVASWLANAGVDHMQGFGIHKPEPLSDVLAAMDGSELLDPAAYLDLDNETKSRKTAS